MNAFLKITYFAAVLFSGSAMAQNNDIPDPLNLAGTYQCTGQDSYEGPFTGVVTLTLNKAGSDLPAQHASYQMTLKAKIGDTTSNYAGYAAATADHLAIYFANEDKQDKVAATDYGVGTATVTHEKNSDGKIKTTFQKFYYLPEYKTTGGYGIETCVK